MSTPPETLVSIDTDRPEPPYEQIRAGIVALIDKGVLPPGHRLPTVRQLAADVGVAVNTAARAYRELEGDGAVETRGRQGTFVAHPGDARMQAAIAEAEAFAARIVRIGIPPAEGARLAARALGVPGSEA